MAQGGTLSSSENSIRSSRVQLRPMGEMFSMPFRNSMKVPLGEMGWEGGRGSERRRGLSPAPPGHAGDEDPPTNRSGPERLQVPWERPALFSSGPGLRGGLGKGGVSPLLGQFQQRHVAEAEVDQVLQQLLPEVVLDGLGEGHRAECGLVPYATRDGLSAGSVLGVGVGH